ncbi:MAG: hypothetical protein ABI216_04075 [Devosia sp.]
MRPHTYYLIAALLVLATVPMYRYIFTHASETDDSRSTVSREQVALQRFQAPVTTGGSRPLLPVATCKQGVLYLVDGNGYLAAKGADGVAVHCRAGPPPFADHAANGQDVRDLKTWYAYNEKLPDGYKCSAADGPVYRTRIDKGATVIEPLVRGGVIVHCGGDERSSHR